MFLVVDLNFCKNASELFWKFVFMRQNVQNKPNVGQRHFTFMVDIQFTLITCRVWNTCVLQLIYLPPPWGDCKVTAMDSDFFDSYSITACRIDCETRYLVDNCNCRMVHMPGRKLCSANPGEKLQTVVQRRQSDWCTWLFGSRRCTLLHPGAVQRMCWPSSG